jgi:metal-sulfur cluster biosynthetic enzyme
VETINTLVIEAEVIEALRTCFDPEIPVNIYELGLIYEVKVEPSGAVGIRMTLTSPHCPAAQSLPPEVEAKGEDRSWRDGCQGRGGLGPALGSEQDVGSGYAPAWLHVSGEDVNGDERERQAEARQRTWAA